MLKVLSLISLAIYVSAQKVDGCIGKAPYQEVVFPKADIDTSNVDLLKQEMTTGMKVNAVEGCSKQGVLKSIQILLADPETEEQLLLEPIGHLYDNDLCDILYMNDTEFIQTIRVQHLGSIIYSLKIETS